jgi:hypothetical protein
VLVVVQQVTQVVHEHDIVAAHHHALPAALDGVALHVGVAVLIAANVALDMVRSDMSHGFSPVVEF